MGEKSMLIIQKKFVNKIKKLKKLSEDNTNKEAQMFDKLCAEMDIHPDSEDGDCLFDHVFNDLDWSVEYE